MALSMVRRAACRDTYLVIAVVGGALQLMKGFTVPNAFVAGQQQLDYSFGIIRRGLFGELMHAFGVPIERFAAVMTVSFILLAIAVAALVFQSWRAYRAQPKWAGPAIAVWFAGYGFAFLVSLVGFMDIVFVPLIVLLFWVESTIVRLLLTIVLGVPAILIHELFLVAFLPLALLPSILTIAADGARRRSEAAILAVAVVALVGVTLAMMRLTRDDWDSIQAVIEARTDFVMYSGYHHAMTESGFALMKRLWQTRAHILGGIAAALTFGPTIVLLTGCSLILAVRYLRATAPVIAVICLCVVAPIALCLQGTDTIRWFALSALNSFLVLAFLLTRLRGRVIDDIAGPNAVRNVVVVFAMVGLASGGAALFTATSNNYPYMDGQLTRIFQIPKMKQ